MNEAEAIDFGREAIFTLLKIGAPIMLTSLVTGVIIAIVQALTQIQEMTLTFVPKIIVMFFVLMALLPFIINELTVFMGVAVDRIINIS